VNVFACLNAVSQLVLRQFHDTMAGDELPTRPTLGGAPTIAS
jgi:hypothetical protein